MSDFWFEAYYSIVKKYVGLRGEFEAQCLSNKERNVRLREVNLNRQNEFNTLARERDFYRDQYFALRTCTKRIHETHEQAAEEAKRMHKAEGKTYRVYECYKHSKYAVFHITKTRKFKHKSA